MSSNPLTLAVDVGGTGVKLSLVDGSGRMCGERVRTPTPYPCRPAALLEAIARMAEHLPGYERISLGFPGVVRGGRIITAPHFGTKKWRGRRFADDLQRRFGKPARILNDAEVQGLGIVPGHGLELVLTLGTGVGSALFNGGQLAPHLELAHHPIRGRKTYNDYVGEAARKKIGSKRWNRRVSKVVAIVARLVNYDVLYLGGGNSAHVTVRLPENVRLAGNDAGLTGGIRLWDDRVWRALPGNEAEARVTRLPMRGSAVPDAPRQ
ncbi:MAG TPA: ROK family protein [Stellaceae bacterium]|nr:ROK family protein [Stellaceae bacterium]